MSEMSCPACGATVDLAVDHTTGERVPLESYVEAAGGMPRYRVVGSGPPTVVERVPDDAPGSFYPDHRADCKDFGAGLGWP